jgi:hypothetical protein
MWERPDCRNDVRNEANESINVVLAVIQNIGALLVDVWRALHDPHTHVLLVRGIDTILAEIGQRTTDAVEALFAVATLNHPVVREVAEFDVRIDHACWLRPAACNVGAEFGGDHVTDDQGVVVYAVRRVRTELVTPLAYDSVRSHLACDET